MGKFEALELIKSLEQKDLDVIIDDLNDCGMISTVEEPLATYYLIAKNWSSSCAEYIKSKGCKDGEIICRMITVDKDTDKQDDVYFLSRGYVTSQEIVEHVEKLRSKKKDDLDD